MEALQEKISSYIAKTSGRDKVIFLLINKCTILGHASDTIFSSISKRNTFEN